MLLAFLVSLAAAAPASCDLDTPPEAPALYVLTASSGDQPFMFLGHSSLWLRDPDRGLDHVWEFGVIDSRRQEPLSNLLLGSLLCSWEVRPARRERRDYRRQRRRVIADRVDLSAAQLDAVAETLLEIQAQKGTPERFDWRRNSCATKVRDVLDAQLGGRLQDALTAAAPASARSDVLRHVEHVPWAWAGLHLLAGPSSDAPQTLWESAFVPLRLREVLGPVGGPDGPETAGLLAEACTFQTSSRAGPPPRRTRRTGVLWCVGLALGGVVAGLAARGRSHRTARVLAGAAVSALGLLWGALGTVLLGLWAASALPVFSANQHLLLASPLSLGWMGLGAAVVRGRVSPWGRRWAHGLAVFGLVSVGLCLLPAAPQDAAELTGVLLPPVLAAWAAVVWTPRSPLADPTSGRASPPG